MPAQESDETTITIISHADLGQVQGATEPYYVTRELRHEYDVHLFAYSDPGFDGVTFHQLDSVPGAALIGLNLIQLPTIIKHLRRTGTDVLYTYKGFHIGAWLAARVAECKWIIDVRSSPTTQKREFSTINGTISKSKKFYWDIADYCYRVALPRADRVVTLSEGIASELIKVYNVKPNQLIYLPLGVDSSKFDPAPFDVVRGNKPYDCVYLGSITNFRGIDTLLDGISHLDLPEDDIAVHIIGSGPQDDISWLQAKADDLGISDIVTWHGYVDHEDIPELLAGMDIALSPLPDHESFRVSSPAKIYEYLSMGLPIVASDIEAHETVLTEEKTGFLFPSGNASGLADALRDAITAIEERESAVRKSVRAEGTRHDWKQRIKPVIEFIESDTPE
jgi:glycosyltransferase involved in cell wall biosynthesis